MAQTRRRGRWASIRLVFSVALLGGVILAFFFQAAVGAGTIGEDRPPVSSNGLSWNAFVEDARTLHTVIRTEQSAGPQQADTDRWAPHIAGLTDDLSLLLAAEGSATGRVDAALADLRRQQEAASRLTGIPDPRSVGQMLSHLIEDATILALAEREDRMGELEAASRSSVHLLGYRTLIVALLAAGAAVAMTGLALSVDELGAARFRRPVAQPLQLLLGARRLRAAAVGRLAPHRGRSAATKSP